jgi:IS4 transposase
VFRINQLHELLKGLPRGEFDRAVRKHQADKYTKGFGCWDQFIAMLYAQLSGVGSLRELESGFNSHRLHHYHLGTDAVRRSTLAEANGRRSTEVFSDIARYLMAQVGRSLRKDSEDLLYLLDSTSITLKGPGFNDWTLQNRTRRTQGIKLHVLYAAHEQAPVQFSFTAANVNDVTEGAKLPIEAGATYVFDKGYCDYNWWADFDKAGARFVTRFKYNAALQAEACLLIPNDQREVVLEDSLVRFSNPNPGGKRRNRYTAPLRRIQIARPGLERPLILATNDLESPASVIAQCYKDRWQIELFFKWIKQHLKLKRYLGHSEKAVRTQILCALISYLLLALFKARHCFKGSLWELLGIIRATLFQRPEIDDSHYRKRRERRAEMEARQPELFA